MSQTNANFRAEASWSGGNSGTTTESINMQMALGRGGKQPGLSGKVKEKKEYVAPARASMKPKGAGRLLKRNHY